MAENAKAKLPSDVAEYFRTAKAGDWSQASNAYHRVSSRLEHFPLDDQATVLLAVRQPMLEAHLALEWFTKAQPKFATAFGRDIVASIPAGSVYFGGTDPGRGLVTAFAKSPPEAGAIFVLTQNVLADGRACTAQRISPSVRQPRPSGSSWLPHAAVSPCRRPPCPPFDPPASAAAPPGLRPGWAGMSIRRPSAGSDLLIRERLSMNLADPVGLGVPPSRT